MYIRKIVVTLQYFLLTPKKCSKTASDKKGQPRLPPSNPPQISTNQQIPPFFLSYTHTVGDLTTNCFTKGLFK